MSNQCIVMCMLQLHNILLSMLFLILKYPTVMIILAAHAGAS